MPKRRPAPEISLSFWTSFAVALVLSSCLMITKTVEPQVLEESTVIAEARR